MGCPSYHDTGAPVCPRPCTARKKELNFEWEKQPFATDAFVFVVNEDNPVDSITVEQARDIYSGKITNWKELGGEDRPITALQRNEGAGSQTLMEKLVMQGTPMMEAPTEYIVTTMGQLMEAVKSFDGSPGAIGYSVYYYAEEMKMAQGLKLLKLEGVEPNPETIRSERAEQGALRLAARRGGADAHRQGGLCLHPRRRDLPQDRAAGRRAPE